ncbi:hypothetical protein C2S51_003340 [Perilla frutescens var. frutescens]|nr:hypothetical protein C2S51_003340 [Perilla frutescens var. frutescens]
MEGKTTAAYIESDDVMKKFRLKRFVKHDRGDHYEFEPNGVMINQDGVVWVCGAEHVKKFEETHRDMPKKYEEDDEIDDPPRFTLKFPKRVPANMTFQSLRKKIIHEAVMDFCARLKKTEPQDDNSNSMLRGGAADADATAHHMDIDPLTNNLDMKELDSALHNCAEGNCAACGGAGSSDELKAHNNLVK